MSVLFLAITVAWTLALAISGSADAALFLAPALLIALPLVLGRFPGERLIVALATRVRESRRPVAKRSPMPRAPEIFRPRGGRLIASSLAERGPPGPLTA